jgi:hypothetical protein
MKPGMAYDPFLVFSFKLKGFSAKVFSRKPSIMQRVINYSKYYVDN